MVERRLRNLDGTLFRQRRVPYIRHLDSVC